MSDNPTQLPGVISWSVKADSDALERVFSRYIRGVPVAEFGSGWILIGPYVTDDGNHGLYFCVSPISGTVGDHYMPNQTAVRDLPGLFACFEFTTPESVSVLIGELEKIRAALEVESTDDRQA